MKEIKQFWKYLLNPTPEQKTYDFITKLTRFLIVLGINIAAVTVAVGIQYGFKYFGLIDINILPVIKNTNILEQVTSLILLIILTPIIEELAFRLHLVPSKGNLRKSFFFFIILLINSITPYIITLSILPLSTMACILIVVLIGLIGLSVFNKRFIKYTVNIWTNNYRTVFYSTALVFGAIHIINHPFTITNLIFLPIIVAPQIILGVNTGYLRVKSGLKWGLFLHIIHNFVFIGLLLYLINPASLNFKNYEITSNFPPISPVSSDYSLTIDEVKGNFINSYKIIPYEISFENTKMKDVFAALANTKNANVIFENQEIENTILNIKFNSRSEEKTTSTNNQYIVAEKLLKKYKLKAKKYFIHKGYWVFSKKATPIDSLTKHLIPEQNRDNKELLTMRNVTVKELVDKIKSLYSLNCTAFISDQNKYNFIIPKNDLAALQKTLLEEYGFEFSKLERGNEYLYISSQDAHL